MNFVEDQTIESQIERLREVLPTPEEQEKAAKGLAKIDTTRMTQVIKAVNEEAQKVMVDLSTAPQTRTVRRGPTAASPVVNLENRRKRRAGLTLSEPQPEEEEPATPGRRPRRSL